MSLSIQRPDRCILLYRRTYDSCSTGPRSVVQWKVMLLSLVSDWCMCCWTFRFQSSLMYVPNWKNRQLGQGGPVGYLMQTQLIVWWGCAYVRTYQDVWLAGLVYATDNQWYLRQSTGSWNWTNWFGVVSINPSSWCHWVPMAKVWQQRPPLPKPWPWAARLTIWKTYLYLLSSLRSL